MATRTRQLRVEIVGDPRHIMRTFDSIEKSTGRLSRGVSRFGTLAAAGLAAFAGGKVVGAIKSMVDEAREAERVGKTTEARLKSTGGVAGITAKQIEKLSTSLSNKLGIDDEIIQSGANMMLTFKGVRDAAGRNNDIFTQATKLSVDLAAGMHQGQVTAEGLQGANIQLGKALEDPIKGITALRRVGVSFTQSQRDQIKALVESGHTLEAQKIILKAVGDQFAGSAKAAATPWQRLGVVIGNIKEKIGTALLPILDRAATFMTDRFIPAAERFWKEHGPKFREVIRQIGELFSTKVGPAIRDFAETQGPRLAAILMRVGTFITKTVIPALAGMGRWLNEHKTLAQSVAVGILAIIAGVKVWAAVTKTMAAVQAVLNIVMAANPIGLVILAIAALAAGIIYAYKHSKTFRDVVSNVFDFIRDKIATVVNFIIGVIRGWLNIQIGVVLGILRVMGKLPGPMGEPFRKAEEAVKKAKKTINDEIDKIQAKVNKLHGKDIPITASLSLGFTKSFTQKDWVDVRLAAQRIATGGLVQGPGTSTSDSVPALLSSGEFVMSAAAVRQIGVDQLKQMNATRFAAGGPVGQIDACTSAINKVQAKGTSVQMDRGLTKMLSMFGGGGASAQAILNFIRMVDRLPYIWGGVGPAGYDCSGLVSEIWNRVTGSQSYVRRWTTQGSPQGPPMNFMWMGRQGNQWVEQLPGGGYRSGTARPRHAFVVGLRMNLGRGGHTAGSFMGLNFEAANPRAGVRVGGAAASPWSFPWQYYLPAADRKYGIGRFDNGGWLPPGTSVAVNRTGRAERVLAPGEGAGIVVNFHGPVYGDKRALTETVRQGIREALRREGRPVTV